MLADAPGPRLTSSLLSMGDSRYARCRRCGRGRDETGPLSWTRLCGECGDAELVSNIEQMHARAGPNFDLWRRNMALSVGGLLLDDIEAALQTQDGPP